MYSLVQSSFLTMTDNDRNFPAVKPKPLYKAWWFYVIIFLAGVIVVVVFGGIILVANLFRLSGATTPSSTNSQSGQSATSAQSVQASFAGNVDAQEIQRILQERQAVAAAKPPKIYQVSTAGAPSVGAETAKIQIVAFEDFQCPYSKAEISVIQAILQAYPKDVRFVYRNFPVPGHDDSELAAEAALCANDQGKFWEYHDLLFANQTSLPLDQLTLISQRVGLDTATFNACLQSRKYQAQIIRDLSDAQGLEVQGTPTFFINGQKIVGAAPLEVFQKVVASQLLILRQK